MTRGRRGSLALQRRALTSPPSCRLIPALPRPPAVFVSLRCQLFTLLASPTNSDAAAGPRQSSSLGDDLAAAGWAGSRIARGDLAEEIAALRGESGGEIMAHGGATFVQALSRLS